MSDQRYRPPRILHGRALALFDARTRARWSGRRQKRIERITSTSSVSSASSLPSFKVTDECRRPGSGNQAADVITRAAAVPPRLDPMQTVLTEGGPTLLAQVVSENVLDELFLTSSPLLFGRYPNDDRKSLTHGLDLGGAPLELLSARRHESHLFLRYALKHRKSAP